MRYIADVPRYSTLSRLAATGQDQWGLFTRRQAEAAGVSKATVARITGRGGFAERVAPGVYRLTSSPPPDNLALRAAWLQLAPEIPAWDRTAAEGVVSHRSAAALYGIGDLPADRHDFTLPKRRQTRRNDVRLHTRQLGDSEWIALRGLPVTRPSRIASDLLHDQEDPGAVARIAADAIRRVYDYPGTFADSLGPHARRFGLRKDDGLALLRWFLDLAGDPETSRWMDEARAHVAHAYETKQRDSGEHSQHRDAKRTVAASAGLTL